MCFIFYIVEIKPNFVIFTELSERLAKLSLVDYKIVPSPYDSSATKRKRTRTRPQFFPSGLRLIIEDLCVSPSMRNRCKF